MSNYGEQKFIHVNSDTYRMLELSGTFRIGCKPKMQNRLELKPAKLWEEIERTSIMDRNEEPVSKERTLTAKWDDRAGDMIYTMHVFGDYKNGERRLLDEHYGDAEWAGRVAAHYNIEMPKESE